jgi:hypothetical protein
MSGGWKMSDHTRRLTAVVLGIVVLFAAWR